MNIKQKKHKSFYIQVFDDNEDQKLVSSDFKLMPSKLKRKMLVWKYLTFLFVCVQNK